MAREDRPTDTARASMNSRPMRAQADAPGRRKLRADRAQQQRPMDGRHQDEGCRAQHDDDRDGGRVDGEDRSEQDLLGGTGGGAHGRVEVEEQRGQPGGRTEHDAGGQIPAPHPLDADEIHGPATDHPAADEADERAEAEVEGTRPPVVARSVSAWPANDWLRTTVKTPTMAEQTAVTVPMAAAVRTGPLEKNPGSNRRCTAAQDTVRVGMVGDVVGLGAGFGRRRAPGRGASARRRGVRRAC